MGREVRRKERQEREAGDEGERKSKKERERWINRDYFLRERDFAEKRGEAKAEAATPGRTGKTGPRSQEQQARIPVTAPTSQAGVCWPGDRQPPHPVTPCPWPCRHVLSGRLCPAVCLHGSHLSCHRPPTWLDQSSGD